MLKVGLIIHTQIFMLKNKIYKYFASEILKSFLTILFAFTAIAWTVRAVNFLDLIVENGHAISTYLYFSLLNITNIIKFFTFMNDRCMHVYGRFMFIWNYD